MSRIAKARRCPLFVVTYPACAFTKLMLPVFAMTLPVAAFLQRWLLHVPVPQTRVVRSYGLYHPTQAKVLAVCRTALGQLPVEAPVPLTWQTVCAPRGEAHPERCPTCGQRLVCTGVIPRGGAPPSMLAGERAA